MIWFLQLASQTPMRQQAEKSIFIMLKWIQKNIFISIVITLNTNVDLICDWWIVNKRLKKFLVKVSFSCCQQNAWAFNHSIQVKRYEKWSSLKAALKCNGTLELQRKSEDKKIFCLLELMKVVQKISEMTSDSGARKAQFTSRLISMSRWKLRISKREETSVWLWSFKIFRELSFSCSFQFNDFPVNFKRVFDDFFSNNSSFDLIESFSYLTLCWFSFCRYL